MRSADSTRSRSHPNRPISYAVFAIVIVALVPVRQTAQTADPIQVFWRTETCSTFVQIVDLLPSAFPVGKFLSGGPAVSCDGCGQAILVEPTLVPR